MDVLHQVPCLAQDTLTTADERSHFHMFCQTPGDAVYADAELLSIASEQVSERHRLINNTWLFFLHSGQLQSQQS